MTMGGGCHGCSMSKLTMLDGVQTMLSEAIPAVQRVKDLTDHATGENPYYRGAGAGGGVSAGGGRRVPQHPPGGGVGYDSVDTSSSRSAA